MKAAIDHYYINSYNDYSTRSSMSGGKSILRAKEEALANQLYYVWLDDPEHNMLDHQFFFDCKHSESNDSPDSQASRIIDIVKSTYINLSQDYTFKIIGNGIIEASKNY